MNLRYLTIAILTVALAGALLAQGPGPHRMMAKTDKVQSYLGLSDAQIQSLKQLRESERTAVEPIMKQMAPLHQSLHAQMEATDSDTTATAKTLASIQSLQQQLTVARNTYRQQALAVLTADQKTKLAVLENAMSLMPAAHEALGLGLLAAPERGPGGPGAPAMMDHPPAPPQDAQ